MKRSVKTQNQIKKEIEDFYKTWNKNHFPKGLRNAKALIHDDIIVLIGYEILTYLEEAILDDEYSRQAIFHTRRKLCDKFFPIMKQNVELITERKVDRYYVDFCMETNSTCMVIFLREDSDK